MLFRSKSGTVTIEAFAGLNRGGYFMVGTGCTLTYTAGTMVYQSSTGGALGGIVTSAGAQIIGLSASNVKIPVFLMCGNGVGTTTGPTFVSGSPALEIGTVIFLVYSGNQTHGFKGTGSINFDNLYYNHPGGNTGSGFIYFSAGVTYTVKQILSVLANNTSAGAIGIRSTVNGTRTIFTLSQGATQDVYYMGGYDVDSSGGQTIWTRKGGLSNTINWDTWAYPRTVHQSFITE